MSAGLLGAYAVALERPGTPSWLLLGMPVLGVLVALLWIWMTWIGNGWVDFWQERLRDVEREWSSELKPFTKAKAARPWFGVRCVAMLLPLGFVVAWVVIIRMMRSQ